MVISTPHYNTPTLFLATILWTPAKGAATQWVNALARKKEKQKKSPDSIGTLLFRDNFFQFLNKFLAFRIKKDRADIFA